MLELHYYLVLLIINSLMCVGFFSSCGYEIDVRTEKPTSRMIFWWVSFYGNKYIPTFMPAVSDCLVCMSSVHSLYTFWYFHQFSLDSFIVWPFYVLALAGLNRLMARIVGNNRVIVAYGI